MVRKLKYHEQKLLKKVDFISWEVDNNLHEVKIMKRYCVQKREDYTKYIMGLIPTKWDLSLCDQVTASSFCRRRLPVVMLRNKMAENIRMATQLIEQGHVRVGAEVVKDPAFLVTRNLEDFVTWVDTSAIRKHVLEYNEMRDDYEVL
ncbi:U3 small nucleolar ribonucleoprotein protein IMP3 isoform X2 [Anabrus simplex]|uniref:U3 small nucleolar ribonucleoprotein protein IMP3 isoform X2 n=1 Tax=Anabrus simplex TaxID=316456 RepID=UPI0034DCDF80